MITNKERHKTITYSSSETVVTAHVRNKRFRSLEEIVKDFYEIEMEKKRVTVDIPIVLGFAILQYAKLRMLQFYYDCLDRFIDRRDFQLCEMDTDSNYMGLSAPLFDVIKPASRYQFFDEYGQWFPRIACSSHHDEFVRTMVNGQEFHPQPCCLEANKFDQRTPGLFKDEFVGTRHHLSQL